MNNEVKYYYYEPRYSSLREKSKKLLNDIKGKIADLISKSKWLSQKLGIWETYFYTDRKWVLRYNILKRDSGQKEAKDIYTKFDLNKIAFFEAVDIDNFEDFRKQVVSKFIQRGDLRDFNKSEELLTGIENKFDTIYTGPLFYMDFNKGRRKKKNDLIKAVRCNFIKTRESYFILVFKIYLSDKAKEITSKILKQEDFGLGSVNYNSFRNIFLKRKFVASESMGWSLTQRNMQNFISDLSSQVKQNITRHFDGYFNNSKLSHVLPRIELYEVEDMVKFREDEKFNNLFYRQKYFLNDEQVAIAVDESYSDGPEIIQVLKQKGHGNKISSKNDLTDYDNLESDFLLENLFFPCVFSALLKEQSYRLTNLKRKIYDQAVLGKTKSYLKLKKKLIKISLTTQRFESEFSNEDIGRYMDGHYDGVQLNRFFSKNHYRNNEQHLLDFFKTNFNFQINKLNLGVKSINDAFKSVEEIKAYKTNISLQRLSIWLGALALIFTFDPLKNWIINKVYEFIDLLFLLYC